MDYNESIKYLNSLSGRGVKLGLERFRRVCEELGNPFDSFKIIHVAGSNGKGSVCAMITSILVKAGYRVGTYTSPHLINVNERIKFNDVAISDKEFGKFVSKARLLLRNKCGTSGDEITYYEFLTLIAFLFFKDKGVDYAVLEVGLGGRLDATNVVGASTSVITSISLEHTKILGGRVEEITREKCGIIKEGSNVFIGEVTDAVFEVINEICKVKNSKLIRCDDTNFGIEIKCNLNGEFQNRNKAIAVQVCRSMGVSEDHIEIGLLNVRLKGRMEYLSDNLLIDCAHNPGAFKILVNELLKVTDFNRIVIVLGLLKDKDYKKILDELKKLSNFEIRYVKPDSERALEPEVLSSYLNGKVYLDLLSAIRRTDDELVVVCGSLYVVGELLKNF